MTELYASQKETNPFMRLAAPLMKAVTTDVPGGAKNTLWAATTDKATVGQSWYWKPVGVKGAGSSWHAQKPDLAKELWEWTEEQLKDYNP